MKRIGKIIVILLSIIIVISIVWYYITKNQEKKIEEYQPEEEISEEQQRETLISLYFINKATKEVEPEARLIDVKNLVKEPYKTLMELLISGPKNSNLETYIPTETKINSIELKKDELIINFSEEFLNISGKENEEKTIETIVKTMTELTEVNSIKILINGQENKAFNDNEVNFESTFTRN